VKPPKRGSTSPLKAARGSSSGSTPRAGAVSTVWQGSGRSRSWSRSRSPPKQALRLVSLGWDMEIRKHVWGGICGDLRGASGQYWDVLDLLVLVGIWKLESMSAVEFVGTWEEREELRFFAVFAWLTSHQPTVLFSHNKPATSNQTAVLFSQNKPASAISHQPTEQVFWLLRPNSISG
jgi:hypothetical protein